MLKKHKFDSSSGQIGSTEWDAADKLNSKSSSSRNLWTAGIGIEGINNFTTSNRDQLKSVLFPDNLYPTTQSAPTNDQVDGLINFIRGDDVFDEDGDSNTSEARHKLADIYHSDLIVVGKQEAPTSSNGNSNFNNTDAYYRANNGYDSFKNGNSCGGSCSSRKEILYAGSNGGILHAIDTSNGHELWGYIPPNVLKNLEAIVS